MHPGALISQQPKEKFVEQVYKSFHEGGYRVGKKECNKKLPSAVAVNDHMYPRPYIGFDPKGAIET